MPRSKDKIDEKEVAEQVDSNSEILEQEIETGALHHVKYLSGMYREWFLDYASYVILERAVPYINDGLKPVQRRILHAMRSMEDGRYTKVANIIGQTMMYHPHGDASIGDALVQLGQKDLLIDTQGNWGNTLTGDSAAAPRYIEARLTKFALDVVFNNKTTEWQPSYDGRNNEPITLPVKFPLLLAQGVEGIAVGMASKILPHNFNELIEASIKHLKGEEFTLLPDFQTGGFMDASRYNDGLRGGNVKVRAKIEKLDNRTLVIKEVPYGRTTSSLIDSIVKASDKGKIKIKKIDDNTAANVEILIHLGPGVSSDQTIDALYAFSDCELSISPNSSIIDSDKPIFIGVSEILRRSAVNTVALLTQELNIKRSELEQQWHSSSLERIFIEERIYKDRGFEEAPSMAIALEYIDKRLDPWKPSLWREIVEEDLLKLMEIKMARILKFNSEKAADIIARIEDEIAQIDNHLANIVDYSIAYYRRIGDKYGKGKERKTEIRSFENIEASKVIITNSKLYIDREEGFIGIALKKAEYLCDCSDLDDIIIIKKSGSYMITRVSQKAFIGKDIIHIAIFKKGDKRTIYNMVYRDGRGGSTYMKRFFISGIARDKEYNATPNKRGTKILYFSANPNGEAETLRVTLKPNPRSKKLLFDIDMGSLKIKGRSALGNLVSKHDVHKVSLKSKGASTLGGRKIWFDRDVLRLNAEERGDLLGEFKGDDKILTISDNAELEIYSYDLGNHFASNLVEIKKLKEGEVVTAVYFNKEQGYFYIKRFKLEASLRGNIRFIGDDPDNRLEFYSTNPTPLVKIKYGGIDSDRLSDTIEASEFIGEKSHKAKGKRLTTYKVEKLLLIEPVSEEKPAAKDQESEVEETDSEQQMTLDFNE